MQFHRKAKMDARKKNFLCNLICTTGGFLLATLMLSLGSGKVKAFPDLSYNWNHAEGGQARSLLPPLSRWTVGGSLTISPGANGAVLRVTNGDWGHCWVEGSVDVDANPYLALWVSEAGQDGFWTLTVNDPAEHKLQEGNTGVGWHVYDLRRNPGWHGIKRFRIYLTVTGRGKTVSVQDIRLSARSPLENDGNSAPALVSWEGMNNARAMATADELVIGLAKTPGDAWGGLSNKVNVDVDRYPFLEMDVARISPGTRWRVEAGVAITGPESRNTGTIAFNYRDFNRWHGRQDLDFRLIVLGSRSEAHFTNVRLVPYPTASATLVRLAEQPVVKAAPVATDLQTGAYSLRYNAERGVFTIQKTGGKSQLLTRFFETPGLNLTPAAPGDIQKTQTADGAQITFHRKSGALDYEVKADTVAAAPGLLHWRVSATATDFTTLDACGHELAYAPPPTDMQAHLRRVFTNFLCANGLASAVAPDLGTVLYLQNYTALNPLFERTHMSPRLLVGLSDHTLGCAAPMSRDVKIAPGATLTLADTYLYLSPGEAEDSVTQAATFIEGLSAIYDHLPDRPATAYHDWRDLAQASLKDLNRPECWGVVDGSGYLQPYLEQKGKVAQLTSLADVLYPLMQYEQLTGEPTIAGRLHGGLANFWRDNPGRISEFAQPGQHTWWHLEYHVNLCRAALLGDNTAKDLCLKAAPNIIKLAHDTQYTFERADILPFENEMAAVYALYMMLAHELSLDPQFLEEAKIAAAHFKQWSVQATREIFWPAEGCEALARLYEATKDRNYVNLSLIPLASILRNAWLWECDYGHARPYRTFWGLNADGSGIDYIAAMEQHQTWYCLRQYYLRLRDLLPASANNLVTEAIRYIPGTIWYSYPMNLPANSLQQGETFWKSNNHFDMAIPVEDVNDGWRKNASVGQELYGAGAVFNVVNEAYTRVPQTGMTIYCEYPLLHVEWDAPHKTLLVHIGGVPQHRALCEVSLDPKMWEGKTPEALKAEIAPYSRPQAFQELPVTVVKSTFRTDVPGGSMLKIQL
jgi:hypothetical protein